MSPELDAALCRDFPLLYKDRNGDPKQTLMGFGFGCRDGWEPLIRELSAKLEALIAALPDDEERPKAFQVKEKFGTLRFYMGTSTEEIQAAIREAEDKSALICEACGKPGATRGTPLPPAKWRWVQTLCDEHEAEYQASKKGPDAG